MRFSVVIPMYRSEETIAGVVDEVCQAFHSMGTSDYEIVLVDDCSPDDVLSVSQKLAESNLHIKVISLAKNVGQTNATLAGYSVAAGEYIITMDDDMQTPGFEIPNLISAITSRDDDVVFASYDDSDVERPLIRVLGTKINRLISSWFTNKPRGLQTNSFMIMKRFVAQGILAYRERDVYQFGVMFELTSYVSNVQVKHRSRLVGKSGYRLRSLVGLLVSGCLSFTLKPIRLVLCVGVILLGMAVASAIVCLNAGITLRLALSGVQIVAVGLVGEYLGRLFLSESNIPRFVIREVYSSVDKPTNEQVC